MSLQYNLRIQATMSVIFGYAHFNAVHSANSLSVKHTVLDSKYSSLDVNILTDCFKYRSTLFNREKSASNFLIDDTRASRHG